MLFAIFQLIYRLIKSKPRLLGFHKKKFNLRFVKFFYCVYIYTWSLYNFYHLKEFTEIN